MKALILASDGRRAMTECRGKPAIGYVLDALEKNMVYEVVVCVGIEAERVKQYCMLEYSQFPYEFVEGDAGGKVGTALATLLSRDLMPIASDVVIIHGDVAFEPKLLARVLEVQGSCIAVDWGAFSAGSYTVSVQRGRILSIAKDQFQEEAFGRSVGIYKLRGNDFETLCDDLETGMKNAWEKTQPIEFALDRLILSGVIHARPAKIGDAKWASVQDKRRRRHRGFMSRGTRL